MDSKESLSQAFHREIKRYDDGYGCSRQQLVDALLVIVSQSRTSEGQEQTTPKELARQIHEIYSTALTERLGVALHPSTPLELAISAQKAIITKILRAVEEVPVTYLDGDWNKPRLGGEVKLDIVAAIRTVCAIEGIGVE